MQLPDAKYGEAANFQAIQQGAALGPGPSAPSSQPAPQVQMPTPLGAPTSDPNQPVTAGADAGAGPGSDMLGLPNQGFSEDVKRRLGPLLPFLIRKADDPTASQDLKDQVRYLISQL
jgi:hypothetical protein